MSRSFEGSATGPLPADTVLECGVCWWVYDPREGDPTGYVDPGTAFSALPEHWRCPSCDADQSKFMVLNAGTAPFDTGSVPRPTPPTGMGALAAGAQNASAPDSSIQDPSTQGDALARLLGAYRKAEEAMVGLPVHNGALRVEAVGFRAFGEGFAGIVITPWCMNLTYVPSDASAPPPVAIGASRQHVFPSGTYSFIMGRMDGVGTVETCSLFSPMDDFTAQDDARAAAMAAVEALFEAPEEEEAPKPKAVTRRFILTRNGAEP
ncbi:MAG: [NiFe]-hydrogenase assembly chaperone HybE [Alphaproteobacteria bacterium]